jgi:hypothetical protein
MAMKLLTFDDQLVAYFAANEEDDNFAFIDILQDMQVSCTQFEVRKQIGAQAFDRFRGRRGLVLQPGQDRRFQDSLVTDRQRPQLSFCVVRDGHLERRDAASINRVGQPPWAAPFTCTASFGGGLWESSAIDPSSGR